MYCYSRSALTQGLSSLHTATAGNFAYRITTLYRFKSGRKSTRHPNTKDLLINCPRLTTKHDTIVISLIQQQHCTREERVMDWWLVATSRDSRDRVLGSCLWGELRCDVLLITDWLHANTNIAFIQHPLVLRRFGCCLPIENFALPHSGRAFSILTATGCLLACPDWRMCCYVY